MAVGPTRGGRGDGRPGDFVPCPLRAFLRLHAPPAAADHDDLHLSSPRRFGRVWSPDVRPSPHRAVSIEGSGSGLSGHAKGARPPRLGQYRGTPWPAGGAYWFVNPGALLGPGVDDLDQGLGLLEPEHGARHPIRTGTIWGSVTALRGSAMPSVRRVKVARGLTKASMALEMRRERLARRLSAAVAQLP